MSALDALLDRFREPSTLTEPESVAGRDRAVVELMVLVSLADDLSSDAERSEVREFAESRPWPLGTSAEAVIEEATAAVRAARSERGELRRLVEALCIRIDHPEDQAFALDHLVATAESDGVLDPRELDFIDELRVELGLPT